jgi:protein MAK16
MEMVTSQLELFPEFQQHKCKQRLLKIHQYLIRARRLRGKVAPKLVRVHKKTERREEKREAKAVRAAGIERAIEKELLERLKAGAYGDIYNFPQSEFEETMEKTGVAADVEEEEEEEEAEEYEAEMEDEEEDEDERVGLRELVAMEDGEDDSDVEDLAEALNVVSGMGRLGAKGPAEVDDGEGPRAGAKRPRDKGGRGSGGSAAGGGARRRRVEVEYEREEEPRQQARARW